MGTRANWSGRFVFIMAATGSAVGLGNLWKFPYITGIHGGGAFVLVYLFSIACVGLPALLAELYIGQKSQANPVKAFEVLHEEKTKWRIPGITSLIATFIILSFYSVVGGWVIDFEFRSLLGQFSSLSAEQASGVFGTLLDDPVRQTLAHLTFMVLTVLVILGGVKDGLEKWTKLLMPGLGFILIGLFFYSMSLEGFGQAASFLFKPDFSKLSGESVLEAIGHSFFTLSLGMGIMITYGSYLNKNEKLVSTTLTVALLDTVIALIAGLVIFSIVFTFGQQPAAGPGLMFSTLPSLFSQLPGGGLLSAAFFLLVSFAALSSSVSLLEVLVCYLEENFKFSRKKATLLISPMVWIIGLLSVLSTNVLKDFKMFGLTFFDLFDRIASSYLLPLAGMLIAIFAGWVLGKKHIDKMLADQPEFSKTVCLWLLKVVTPISILIVLLRVILK